MTSREIVREKLNAYIKDKGWSNHTPLIKEGRLTNGTLGRIRKDAENIRLDTLDDLAAALNTTAAELISARNAAIASTDWYEAGKIVANQSAKPRERELLLDFLTAIQSQLKEAQRFAESIPDIAER